MENEVLTRKTPLRGMLYAAAIGVAGFAASDAPARAEWACEVALCLSNPAGPMAVSECVPPIRQLYRHLAEGGSFPLCRSADGHVNFTRYGREEYERCPDGSAARVSRDEGSFPIRRGVCEVFVPGGAGGPRYEDDHRLFETRRINGELVWGEVVEEDAVRRSRPRYLDYVVEGRSQRIWF